MSVIPFSGPVNSDTSTLSANPSAVALLREAHAKAEDAQRTLVERFTMFCAMHGVEQASLVSIGDTAVTVRRGA